MNKKLWIVELVVVVIAIVAYAFGKSSVPPQAPVTQTPPGQNTHPTAQVGERCGGNMMNAPVCAANLHCMPTPGSHLPFGDVGGTCVAN